MTPVEAVARALARRNNADRFWQMDAQYLDYAHAALDGLADYFAESWQRAGDATGLPNYSGCSEGCIRCLFIWLREQAAPNAP